jgi:hypothetical protein
MFTVFIVRARVDRFDHIDQRGGWSILIIGAKGPGSLIRSHDCQAADHFARNLSRLRPIPQTRPSASAICTITGRTPTLPIPAAFGQNRPIFASTAGFHRR